RWLGGPAALLLAAVATVNAADPALSELAQGINAYNARDFNGAVQHLRVVRIPRLFDYVAWHLASAQQQTSDFDGALGTLAAYRASPVAASPLAGKISLLHARILIDKHGPAEAAKALDLLQSDYKLLPQPEGDFALGLAY